MTLQKIFHRLPTFIAGALFLSVLLACNVRMSRKYKLEDFLFDLDAVKLEMAPALGQRALERLGFSNGRIVLYKIETEEDPFARTNDLATQWTVFLPTRS